MTLEEISKQLDHLHGLLLMEIKRKMYEDISERHIDMVINISLNEPAFNAHIQQLCKSAERIATGISLLQPEKPDTLDELFDQHINGEIVVPCAVCDGGNNDRIEANPDESDLEQLAACSYVEDVEGDDPDDEDVCMWCGHEHDFCECEEPF